MAWDDIAQLEAELSRSLDAFDWAGAERLVRGLVARVRDEADAPPADASRNLLYMLRRQRRFALIRLLAEALLQTDTHDPRLRLQYAQALIDDGSLAAAEAVLRPLVGDPRAPVGEESEARGLAGRISKQLYVNRRDPSAPAARHHLERALAEYLYGYRLDPQRNLWHGINIVALSARARRDRLPEAGLPDERRLAEEILDVLGRRAQESAVPLPWWDTATALEAYVALGRHAEAAAAASRYIHVPGVDAFALASTIRQLTEVWQLNESEPPGDLLLPICKAGYLAKQGAVVEGDSAQVRRDAAAAGGALKSLEAVDAGAGLEKVFGADTMVTLAWYKKGLEQCSSIARVETPGRRGHGTGWLVEAADFFPDRRGPLLLTNEHVVSDDDQHPFAILPDGAWANFQAHEEVIELGEVVWSSPYTELDATFVSLLSEPRAKPLVLHTRRMQKPAPPKAPPRMYIIGHPMGRDLELSLQDNSLLACNERMLHYRTPTEPGSSGSPVFEPDDWRVVALHHKGSDTLPRLDGEEGTYPANEGIAILAIQQRTREHTGS